MVNEKKNIEIISKENLDGHNAYHFINCIIGTIDLIGAYDLKVHVVIEGCIINNLQIHSCWFINGLVIKNCIINGYVDYQMGGHNDKPVIIEGNVFTGFFNFFDCQFGKTIELKNNVFEKGTNLLANKGEGFENTFANGWVVKNNVGDVDKNEVD